MKIRYYLMCSLIISLFIAAIDLVLFNKNIAQNDWASLVIFLKVTIVSFLLVNVIVYILYQLFPAQTEKALAQIEMIE